MIWFCAIEFYVGLARLRCCFENVTWNTHYTTLLVEKGHKKTRKQKAREEEMKRGTKTKRKQVRQTQQQSRDLPCPLSLFLSQHSSSQHDGAPRGPPAPVPHSEISELCRSHRASPRHPFKYDILEPRLCGQFSVYFALSPSGRPDLGNVCAHNDKNSQRRRQEINCPLPLTSSYIDRHR